MMDLNGDGVITRAEFDAFVHQLRSLQERARSNPNVGGGTGFGFGIGNGRSRNGSGSSGLGTGIGIGIGRGVGSGSGRGSGSSGGSQRAFSPEPQPNQSAHQRTYSDLSSNLGDIELELAMADHADGSGGDDDGTGIDTHQDEQVDQD